MTRPLHTFQVRVRLPEALGPLWEIAHNLNWLWDPHARELFRRIAPQMWDQDGRDPMRTLAEAGPERLDELASDPSFIDHMTFVRDDLRRRLSEAAWFQGREGTPLQRVAYFSPEFGIAEALPQYSGGLGALAGDHLKAASDLGVPLVAVGLMYHHGYFRQVLDPEGWQQERYPTLDPESMALSAVEGTVAVELAGERVSARIWKAQVGRVPLYLLDANLEENPAELRGVTDRLYGGGQEHRIRQEILLGIGGVRALEHVGERPQVFHTNEGHAAFLCLERIRRLIVDQGLSFPEAVEAVRPGTVFTTHTSVPAGIDRFPRELVERYFTGWAEECGVRVDDLMELGAEPGADTGGPFNMATLAFRLAGFANGVSLLHGEVSRRLFGGLWPDVEPREVPIGSITNGVHARSWVHAEMDDLLSRHVDADWPNAEVDAWAGTQALPDDELWAVRERARERLVRFVRRRIREAMLAKGSGESDLWWVDEVLDPRALTIGFARRFAGYKRANLLLSRPDRLRALLLDAERPVQLVFAGKAHPADDWGKEMIRQIVEFARQPEVWRRLVFVEDYDIGVARTLYQGCDVWLNTPRRPHEACGTSGMKAALNGALNCSILDGWWDEMFDGTNGWAIPSAELYRDEARRDEAEAGGLFELLERRIVPLFYDRPAGLPSGWLARMRDALRSLGPQVTASRMVRDYVRDLYEPAAARSGSATQDSFARPRDLAAWKRRALSAWAEVSAEIESGWEPEASELGAKREVRAVVSLGPLTPDDVDVQLLHGPLDAHEEISDPAVVSMESSGRRGSGRFLYTGTVSCERPGRYGFTVRVVPSHPDLVSPMELGRVARASGS